MACRPDPNAESALHELKAQRAQAQFAYKPNKALYLLDRNDFFIKYVNL